MASCDDICVNDFTGIMNQARTRRCRYNVRKNYWGLYYGSGSMELLRLFGQDLQERASFTKQVGGLGLSHAYSRVIQLSIPAAWGIAGFVIYDHILRISLPIILTHPLHIVV